MLELLTPGQAARRLGISIHQLRSLTNEGLIRWVNVGIGKKRPTRRYTEIDLSAFIEARSSICRPSGPPTAPPPLTSPHRMASFGRTSARHRSGKVSAFDKAFERLVAMSVAADTERKARRKRYREAHSDPKKMIRTEG